MLLQFRRCFIPSRLFVIPCNINVTTSIYKYTTETDAFRLHEFSKKYLNCRQVKFTEKLEIRDPLEQPTFPIYRVTSSDGQFIHSSGDPNLTKEMALKIYQTMVLTHQMDKILYDSQRQGRISFYLTNTGEEASQIGSAAGLRDNDLIYAQYREVGALLWRGFPIENFMHQCYGNAKDIAAGKQMPVHYGSAEHHYITISSPLATQIPQAVGSAYAFKRNKNGRVVLVYFGEGAASEGDTHAAMNMASTMKCPVIFFCRNNGYAISTSCNEQYGGDGISGRAIGYGIHTIRYFSHITDLAVQRLQLIIDFGQIHFRVDGNDLFAVYNATKAARELAQQNKPVLIEAMTYRLGHHSTSDDSDVYRSSEEVKAWNTKDNPITRFRKYIQNKSWWDDQKDAAYRQKAHEKIMKAFFDAEKILKPNVRKMFEDVYKEMPKHLIHQCQELNEHLKSYGQHYPLNKYESE